MASQAPIDRILEALRYAGNLYQRRAEESQQAGFEERRTQIAESAEKREEKAEQAREDAEARRQDYEDQMLDLQTKLNESNIASARLNRMGVSQGILEKFLTSGVGVPGMTQMPAQGAPLGTLAPQIQNVTIQGMQEPLGVNLPTAGTGLAQTGLTPASMEYNIPGADEPITGPSREAFLREQIAQAQAMEEAKQAPETARQIAVAKATQEAEMRRFIIQKQLDSDNQIKLKNIEISAANAQKALQLQFEHWKTMMDLSGGMPYLLDPSGKGMQSTGQTVIQTGPDGKPQFHYPNNLPGNITSGLTNLYNGDTSLEELEAQNPKLKQPMAYLAGQFGIRSMTKKDRDEFHNIQLLQGALGPLNKLYQLKRDHPYEINIPGTKPWADFNSAQKDLAAEAGRQAKVQQGVSRASEADLRRVFEGAAPDRNVFQGFSSEYQKLNDFYDNTLIGHAKVLTQGLSPEQQNSILQTHGFGSTMLPRTQMLNPNDRVRVVDTNGNHGSVARWEYQNNPAKYKLEGQQ